MQVEVRIDDSCSEPRIIILTASITEEVNNLVQKLSEKNPQIISGSKDGRIELLEQNDLFKIYAGSGKVFAVTDNGEYILRLRIYEIEERLHPSQFVRISNSEIINLKKVKNFDFLIVSAIMMPISYVTFWMEHSLKGFLSYFRIFTLIFAIVWVVQYTRGMYNVKKMNEALHKRQGQQK